MLILKMDERGSVMIPKSLRNGLTGDSALEAVRREDGVIELRPRPDIDPDQAWFWTETWQRMEREADEAYAAGEYTTHDDVESFLAALDAAAAAHDEANRRAE
jgi:bifunctional DNA-binding transcriptional regulator/antitoxin component of YhaV-PrlF toxin-antitoxin module